MTEHVITYAGIGQAVQLLVRDGLLDPTIPPPSVAEGFAILDTKATTWLGLSREKGDTRSKQEQDEAYLMACFKLWIEGYVKLSKEVEA